MGTFAQIFAIALALLPSLALGAYCHGSPDPNAASNDNDILDLNATLIKTVEHGKLFKANQGTDDEFYVVHLYGPDAYSNGYAQGELLKGELKAFFAKTWDYMVTGTADSLPGTLPQWFEDLLANTAMDKALDWTAEVMAPYTDQDFFDEMHGLADASGVSYEMILRIHMLPEATQGDCSMFGAWGNALQDKDALLQLRALDWDTDGPFRDYSSVTVYHPPNDEENAYANVAFIGFVGAITGMNDKKMSISEIGVSYPDSTFGEQSRYGIPFTVLLRDILKKDQTIDESLERITDANRTCDLILGVGDGKANEFRGIQYSASVANFYDDTDMMPYNETWHPRIEDVVYWGMDWLCPNYSEVLAEQIESLYGEITAENAISEIIAHTQTGNLHIAVYDLTGDNMYVSFASKRSLNTTTPYAYERAFTRIDMASLFNEPSPSML